MSSKYARIFAILKQVNAQGVHLSHKEAVRGFTDGRTESLSDLSDQEVIALADRLQAMVPYSADKLDGARKAIIAQFRSIGKSAADAKAWAEKYGVNGVKRRFNEYSGQELITLLRNAEKIREQFFATINRSI